MSCVIWNEGNSKNKNYNFVSYKIFNSKKNNNLLVVLVRNYIKVIDEYFIFFKFRIYLIY